VFDWPQFDGVVLFSTFCAARLVLCAVLWAVLLLVLFTLCAMLLVVFLAACPVRFAAIFVSWPASFMSCLALWSFCGNAKDEDVSAASTTRPEKYFLNDIGQRSPIRCSHTVSPDRTEIYISITKEVIGSSSEVLRKRRHFTHSAHTIPERVRPSANSLTNQRSHAWPACARTNAVQR
jgi:hypothetical protein